MTVSIIIIHYKAKEELFSCLSSIKKSGTKISYEVIVIDNDEEKTIEKDLKKKFNWIKYIKSDRNIGYSGGNNLGARYAKGKYLFFLNPDTKIFPGTIGNLVVFLRTNKKTAIAAPLLLDKENNPYLLQGTSELTPLNGIFALSFINKYFPNNPVSRKYWYLNWNKKYFKEVDVVPGTAFMIEKSNFEKVGGFDEKFFLYFEESDFCRRIKENKYKIFITPSSKIVHLWGECTKEKKDIDKIFAKSRFYYFKKHFGLLNALIVHVVTSINKNHFMLGVILILGIFLRFYYLSISMKFIGDQGWFYLSARDMLLYGKIPLVGITSSHTWLHQGPLWTYMVAIALWIFNFNPVSGAYLTAFVGTLSIILIYVIAKDMFLNRAALIASLLYATSPIIVNHSRMPYHISPIPLFVLLFIYFLNKLLEGNSNSVPFIIFTLAVLYNLELATTLFWFVFLIAIFYVLKKRIINLKKILTKKIVILSILSFIIPMLPILIYDFNNDFFQTIKFAAWIPYKIIDFVLGFQTNNSVSGSDLSTLFVFWGNFMKQLLFSYSTLLSLLLFFSFLIYLFYIVYKQYKKRAIINSYLLILITLIISLLGFIVNNTPSEAYLPIFFPTIILITALLFDILMKYFIKPFVILTIVGISIINSYFIFSNFGDEMKNRIEISKEIVREAKGRKYNLIGKGKGSEFKSFTMNYEYLTWWLGNSPVKEKQPLRFVINEDLSEVQLIID